MSSVSSVSSVRSTPGPAAMPSAVQQAVQQSVQQAVHPLVADWLLSLSQALSAMTLYGATHPSCMASRARSHDKLNALLGAIPHAMQPLRLTLLDGELVVGTHLLHDLRGWELGGRLSGQGIQRLEFTAPSMRPDAYGALLELLHRALVPGADAVEQAVVLPGVRVGPVALVEATADQVHQAPHGADRAPTPLLDALLADGLSEELDTLTWITAETAATHRVPLAEVEAVIRGLALAMQAEQGTLLPLVSLKAVDQYTTVHACNVAMLSMGLAEQLGFGSRDVRAVGTAALLHDIGKVCLPQALLTKAGVLSDAERDVMRTHTTEGARLLGERGEGNALAAIVAYEHHVWADGTGGYPALAFPRRPHYVSRLVQVCDVYDALSTLRPYRDPWPRARTLHHMRLQAGRELDYDLLLAFFDLLDRAEQRHAMPLR